MTVTKNHLSVVAASFIKLRTRSLPTSTAVVKPGERRHLELFDVGEIVLHEPLVAVVAPEHTKIAVAGLDGRRRDDGVDSGRRPSADQDGERLHAALRSSSGVYAPERAALL